MCDVNHTFSKPNLKKSPWGKKGCKKWHKFTFGNEGEIFTQEGHNMGSTESIFILRSNEEDSSSVEESE
jgi:hypothetical protein